MTVNELDALIVGAGFSGLYTLHLLRKEGYNVKIYEAGDGIGGTWYWNRYPGARTDSTHIVYQLTQDDIWKGFEFTERFADQKQLLSYFRHVDKKLNLSKDIQFNTRVVAAEFSLPRSQWLVESDDGKFTWAQHLILCTGFAERRYTPPFKGLDTFSGKRYHSSYWPESGVELKGKRVAVIGTGASGVQIIQEIAGEVEHLTVYQRTPNLALPMQQATIQDQSNWTFPHPNEYPNLFAITRKTFFGLDMNSAKLNAMEATEEERTLLYESLYKAGGFAFILGNYQDVLLNKESNNEAYKFWREKTRARINDPVKQEILAPTIAPHPILGKRPSLEQRYYEVFNQNNVDIINVRKSPIIHITKTGIETANEGELNFDIIILATGFDSNTGGILNIQITNGENETIQDKWKDGTWTNLGMTTAGFPNMYFLYGPQAPTAFSNGPTCIEVQAEWIVQLIKHMKAEGKTSVVATKKAEDDWKKSLNDAWNATLLPGVEGWYSGSNIPGKPVEPLNYIGGIPTYITALEASAKNNYEGLEKGFSNETITQFLHKLGKLISPDYINATFISVYATLEELGYSTESMMFELRQPCDRLVKQCVWLGKVVRCDHVFRTSRSSEGFCCAFNYKASVQFLETDNNTNSLEQINAPIFHVSGYGPFVGLSLTLMPEVHHYITDTKHVGVVIFVHQPFDYPDTKVSYVLGSPGSDVNIAVIPTVVESSNDIRNLPLEKRNCYFEDEKKLEVSPMYSFQGCIIDCIVEHIVEYCGCIPFFYPHSHLPKYKNNRQCNLRDVICLRENQHIFSSLRLPTIDMVDVNDTLFGMDCDCLPSCSEQFNEVETTICHRNKFSKLRPIVLGQSFDPENSTTVKIHFKDISCIKYRRELYLTWDGVFAAFGGIFSLCWGGSIISLFEFIYYYTFEFVERILTNMYDNVEKKRRLRNLVGRDNRARFRPINKNVIISRRNFELNPTYFN